MEVGTHEVGLQSGLSIGQSSAQMGKFWNTKCDIMLRLCNIMHSLVNVMRSLVSYYALFVIILCVPWCNPHVQCMCAECCVRG